MASLSLIDNFIQAHHFVCAVSEKQKSDAYAIRLEESRKNFPYTARNEQLIDQYDAQSIHLLLQNKDSQKNIATIRLTETFQPNKSQHLPCKLYTQQQIWIGDQKLSDLEHANYSEASQLCSLNAEVAPDEASALRDVMYLGAFSLARLLFHEFMLLELCLPEFKRLRSLGLQLEQTIVSIRDHEHALFWVSTEKGISPDSSLYGLYQHVLGDIAYQLNQPLIDNEQCIHDDMA